MVIYIAGPYSQGDVAANVARAIQVSHEVMDAGHTPIVPHLSHFSHLQRQRPYEDWMKIDFEFVRVSDALLLLEGKSAGALRELSLAEGLGKPVIYQRGAGYEYMDMHYGRLLSALNIVTLNLHSNSRNVTEQQIGIQTPAFVNK